MTAVDRTTRCIVGWRIEATRVFEMLQSSVDQANLAQHYFSDGFPCYADVYYPGATYQALLDKSQTYSVEGDNAELRHYLARLHRSTRCYSKCVKALRRAVGLFVEASNRRQLFRHAIRIMLPTSSISFLFDIRQSPCERLLTRESRCAIICPDGQFAS
jgi:IS1 family transposase